MIRASEQDSERVQRLRTDFCQHRSAWLGRRVHFLDESGVFLGMTPRYGWASSDARVQGTAPVNYGTPWTMIATISAEGVKAPWLLEGAMNADAFRTYITQMLCPTLQAGDIVVLDNLSSHKQTAVIQAVEARGAQIVFLPPYSPDLNPIELCWSKVKQALREAGAKTVEALIDALAEALRSVSASDIVHWMRHCGYALL